ncbi:DUF3379 family protein [Thalassotalea fusca]
MDDLQFRRILYADPNSTDEAVLSAQAEDLAKQKFAHEIEQLDAQINRALSVPVPGDLKEKLILRQSLASHRQQTKAKRIKLAIAASVAFAVGISVHTLQFSHAYVDIGEYAIAHTEHEADYFSNNSEAKVSLTALNQKMASFNGSFVDTMGELMMADYCRFDGMKSLHLVFKGKSSPVNVFIIPNSEHLASQPEFSKGGLHGTSTRFNQSNIIVVGAQDEPVNVWQQKLNKTVRWST